MTRAARLRPTDGTGVVARRGELVLLCTDAPADTVEQLLAAHLAVGDAGGDAEALAARLATVLASGAQVSLVAFGPAGGSLLVTVYGHAWANVATEYGEQNLHMREQGKGVRSTVPGRVQSVRAGLGDTDPTAAPQMWVSIDDGVVRGGGLVYEASPAAAVEAPVSGGNIVSGTPSGTVTGTASEAPAAAGAEIPVEPAPEAAPIPAPLAEESASPEDLPEAEPEPTQPVDAPVPTPRPSPRPPSAPLPPPVGPPVAPPGPEPIVAPPLQPVDRSQEFSSVVLIATAAPDTAPAVPRAPLPIITAPAEPAAPDVAPPPHPVDEGRVQVLGVYCKNGHFDDPSARYCAICGISMQQLTLQPRPGPRPPLGVLVLDDGSIFSLDTDYVMGRDPSQDPDVIGGEARPLRFDDPEGVLSRRHARIVLDGWQVKVVDLGSANGTGIWGPGDPGWSPLPTNAPTTMRPGTQIGLGRRTLRYESHRNT